MQQYTMSVPEEVVAERAMVALHVPWSRRAIDAVLLFENLRSMISDLAVVSVILDEDAEPVREWLRTIGMAWLVGKYGTGNGSFLWLEHGRVVDFEYAPSNLTLDQLVDRTRNRWKIAA